MIIDSNGRPHRSLDSLNVAVVKPTAFAGVTSNARGDKDGSNATFTIFTVTGDVLVRIFGVCTDSLTSGGVAKLEVGLTGNTALLIAQTTATAIDVNQLWNDASPALGDTLANVLGPFIVPNGLDIIETTSAADISGGNVYYVCLWRPLSTDGLVEATV